jgi:hypothetical protein
MRAVLCPTGRTTMTSFGARLAYVDKILKGAKPADVIVYRGRGPIEPRFCKHRLDKSCSLGYYRVDESGQGIQRQS